MTTDNQKDTSDAMEQHRNHLEQRSRNASDWLEETVQQIIDEKQECLKQTGHPLDPISMKAHIQNSIALSMPMDQAVVTISEAVWKLAEQQEGKKDKVSALFLPDKGNL